MQPLRQHLTQIVFGIALSMCSLTSLAETASNRLIQLFANWHSLTANFQQTIREEKTGKVIGQFSGQLAIDKPGRFRWQVNQPNQQIIIINQQKTWIYDVDLEQVTIRQLSEADQRTPAAFLSSNLADMTQHFLVKPLKSVAGNTRFKLVPLATDRLYQAITLSFNDKQILERLTFSDQLGQRTTIALTNVKQNPVIKASMFKLVLPKGVDVYQQ